MNYYNLQQWMFFFFLYCLIGWVWECCYVSVLKRKWVNRGFLHGPFLPIYGFGALTILVITLPVRENPAAVCFAGALGATILEYVTGAAMEKLFHVRYWDYSNKKWNLNGYISLSSTVLWGVFSVGLVYYIHQPIADFTMQIPDYLLIVLDSVLVIGVGADTVASAREALDLKAVILAEKEKELQLIQKSLALVKENLEESSEKIRSSLEESTEKLRENLEESSMRIRNSILNRKMEEREKLLLLQSELEQRSEILLRKSEKRYKNANRILRRNPGSTFRNKKIGLDGIKSFLDRQGNDEKSGK